MAKIYFLAVLNFISTTVRHLISKTGVIFLAITLFCIPSWVAGEPIAPFDIKEKLTFKLKWEVISAGEAILEVFPKQTINSIETRHFSMRVKTNKFVDIFYRVCEQLDAYTDVDVQHSVLYTERPPVLQKRISWYGLTGITIRPNIPIMAKNANRYPSGRAPLIPYRQFIFAAGPIFIRVRSSHGR